MMLAAFYTLRAFICCVVVHLKLSYKKLLRLNVVSGGLESIPIHTEISYRYSQYVWTIYGSQQLPKLASGWTDGVRVRGLRRMSDHAAFGLTYLLYI